MNAEPRGRPVSLPEPQGTWLKGWSPEPKASAPAVAFAHSQALQNSCVPTAKLCGTASDFDHFGFQTIHQLLRTVKIQHGVFRESCTYGIGGGQTAERPLQADVIVAFGGAST